MKTLKLTAVIIFCFAVYCFAEEKSLLIDNFEGSIHGGAEATVDSGAVGGSSVEVSSDTHIKYSGSQSLKITYMAVPDGRIWVARGFDLDALKSGWLVKPEDINWQAYNAISFYMYGSNLGADIAFDVKDSNNELFRFIVNDDFNGWKRIICRFRDFDSRQDFQPNDASKNEKIDFPIKSYEFEPIPESKGTLYFDRVELLNIEPYR